MSVKTNDNPFLIGANPENFGGNRRDDFAGVVTANLMMPWRYPGTKPREDKKTGKKSPFAPYSLFSRVSILADEDSAYGPIEDNEMFQAGYLASVAPTDDGENPKGATWDIYAKLDAGEAEMGEGEEEDLGAVYVIGKRKGFKLPSSDYAQFLFSIDRLLKEATAEDLRAHGWEGWKPNHDCIAGLHLHFNLLDRDEKMGNRRPTESKDPTAQNKNFKILCATALLDPVEKSTNPVSVAVSSSTKAGSTATSNAKPSKANGAETSSDLESDLEGFVLTQIMTLPTLNKKPTHGNIMAEVPASFQGNIQQAITKLNSSWTMDDARPWVRKGTTYELKEG